MPITTIRGGQVTDGTVQRVDLDVSTVGQAVVRKIVQGSGITLSSTGADSGTGDVTVSSPDVVSTDAGNIATLGTDSHILVPQSQIWSVRLRSFNAVGNPTFEVDQRNVGTALTNPANGTFIQDRYAILKSATLTGTVNTALQSVPTAPIVIPGTNFGITQNYQRFTVGTAQASLAAGDYYGLQQFIEGPRWRELASDHSLSLLARSSIASLAFSVSLRDNAAAHSLVKQCTLGSTPNTWALITLPGLPVWSGTFSAAPGQVGYTLAIVLAAGTTFSTASSVWQTANMLGVTGMSNFLATAGATFDIAYVSHEPGAQASNPPLDCPFGENLDGDFGCLRYYCKSYADNVLPGTVNDLGVRLGASGGTVYVPLPGTFVKSMAKIPTITVYNHVNGAINTVWDSSSGSAFTVSSAGGINKQSFSYVITTVAPAISHEMGGHFVADTGW
jgi:hypothetical protein